MNAAARVQPVTVASREIGDRDFARFQALIHREAGIWLSPVKKALLVGRLARRLRALGVASYAEYYELVEADPRERVRMLDSISTNETHFFREPRHFEILVERLVPRWQAEAAAGARPHRVRVWSAGCSTGEEPFSIAMSLLGALPARAGWEIEILATDLSTRVLERASAALWPIAKAQEIPPAYLKAFMLCGTGAQEGWMKAGPEIRSLVRFARLNLNEPGYGAIGSFDVVFCRNVLIYFDAPTKARVVSRLLEHVAPAGHLFLGHAESLSGTAHAAHAVFPTVYARSGAPARAPGSASADDAR